MKPASFDYPYAPICDALRTIAIPFAIVTLVGLGTFGLWRVSEAKRAQYDITSIDDFSVEGGSLFLERGAAEGPYKSGPGVSGPVGSGINLNVKGQSISCAGVEGISYFAQSFINGDNEARIVVWETKAGR